MPNHFISTHPTTGKVATRSSANRTYTHAIWAYIPQATRLAWQEAELSKSIERLAEYHHVVESGDTGSKYLTVEEYVEKFIPNLQSRIETLRSDIANSQGDEEVGVVAWAGRPDLADKQVVTWENKGWVAVAVPAVQVESKAAQKRAVEAATESAQEVSR